MYYVYCIVLYATYLDFFLLWLSQLCPNMFWLCSEYVLQICFKRQPPSPPDLHIAGTKLEVVNETKLLGLTVQSDLCWDLQFNTMVSKSSRRLYMVSRLKRLGVPVGDLLSVYIRNVRPIVEYACPMWHGSMNVHQTKQIERIQRRACRIILGSKYTLYTDALAFTGLQTLEERRLHLCTQFARNVLHRINMPSGSLIVDTKIEVVNETKLLGLTVQSDLCWDLQFNTMVSKSSCRLYMLSRLKRFGVPVGDVLSVYIGYVRPIVEYTCPEWPWQYECPPNSTNWKNPKKGLPFILGSKYTLYTDVLALTGPQILEERRLHLCTQFAKKCTSEKYAEWFPLNDSSQRMCLRNTRTYQAPEFRTERYGNSSIPYLTGLLD